MDHSIHSIELAEQKCKDNGVRLTQKRKLILLALIEAKKALSAYDLVEYCKTHFKEIIPVMSVYRILDFLEEQGLAHRLNLANKYITCSHMTCSHEHGLSQFLICDECLRVEEISINTSALNQLQTSIKENGFRLNKPQLEINGICNQCFESPTTKKNAPA